MKVIPTTHLSLRHIKIHGKQQHHHVLFLAFRHEPICQSLDKEMLLRNSIPFNLMVFFCLRIRVWPRPYINWKSNKRRKGRQSFYLGCSVRLSNRYPSTSLFEFPRTTPPEKKKNKNKRRVKASPFRVCYIIEFGYVDQLITQSDLNRLNLSTSEERCLYAHKRKPLAYTVKIQAKCQNLDRW